jgi:hypothetical protein
LLVDGPSLNTQTSSLPAPVVVANSRLSGEKIPERTSISGWGVGNEGAVLEHAIIGAEDIQQAVVVVQS